ncbi:MAG: hypothetical protein R3A48_18730 [Polyangiales bacterium]
MNLARWTDALLASPITSGTPRYLEHSLRGRLSAWEIVAARRVRATEVPAWWDEALLLAGGQPSLSQTEAWWRPWRDDDALELAWNRVRGGLSWVCDALVAETTALPPAASRLLAAARSALDDPARFAHPEALEAETEQLLRAAELALCDGDPAAPRRVAGRLHAARRASRGLRAPLTLHMPLSDVRTVREVVLARSTTPAAAMNEAYARVVFYGAQLRSRCAARFGDAPPEPA